MKMLLGFALIVLIGGCMTETREPASSASVPSAAPAAAAPSAPSPATPAPAPIVVRPYDEAFLTAANDLFAKAQVPDAEGHSAHAVVIDPLVDGVSGEQTAATRSMNSRIAELVGEKYPAFAVQPFSAASVANNPIVLVGTFTPVNKEGKTAGPRTAYRICLALADLKTGKIISKERIFAEMQELDSTPLPSFRESPAWVKDAATEAYIKTCQATKVGDPIDRVYADRVLAAALISDAVDAYDAGQYREALDLYNSALQTTAGDQLRTYNGIYLATWRLGRDSEAQQAFARIVDYGLSNKSVAFKILFKPGSTAFWPDPNISGPYDMWLKTIASQTARKNECLEIRGHTSPTGPEPLNERLSQLRADYIKQRLTDAQPTLGNRIITVGMGSRETLIGTGKDDVTDALDRRVSFDVVGCQAVARASLG